MIATGKRDPTKDVNEIEHRSRLTLDRSTRPAFDWPGRRCATSERGQSLVEFVITLTLALMVLVVTIQLAIIGDTALAVTHLASAGARYAAFNPKSDYSAISKYMRTVAAPAIGEGSGANLR